MQTSERSTRSSKRFVPEKVPELQSAPSDTGQYMCIECSETFDNKLELNSHRQSHITKKQFTCSHCGRGFHHQVFLQMHERSHEAGSSRTPPTRTPPSRVISTRSTKSLQEADIIHVAPTPNKSLYHLNSKVEFKREWKVGPDVAPRECVTRRTQGTYPLPCHRSDSSSSKTQFELRISKLSDNTVQLIDPYGNTLEILAEVFNSYTIGDEEEEEEEEEESVSPSGESRVSEISTAPTSSSVQLSAADETADVPASPQDSRVVSPPQAERPEPIESTDDAVMEEDLPVCPIQSVSSISPKTVPDVGDDAEDILSTQTPQESAIPDVTRDEQEDQLPTEISKKPPTEISKKPPTEISKKPPTEISKKPPTEISKKPSEEEVLPSSVKDSLKPCGDQTIAEGPVMEDVEDVVVAQTDDPSPKSSAVDDATMEYSEAVHGGHQHIEESPSKPESPETHINDQETDDSASSLTPVIEDEKDMSIGVATSLSKLDSIEAERQEVPSCVKDSQEIVSDHVMSSSDLVDENKGPGQEEHFASPEKSKDETLLEDERTTVQIPVALSEGVSESDANREECVGDSSSWELDRDLQADPLTANTICSSPVDKAEGDPKDGSDDNQTESKSELVPTLGQADICRLDEEVDDEPSYPLSPVDVCSPKPDSLTTPSVVRSLDSPDQRSLSSSDHEESPMERDIAESDFLSLEKQDSQAIVLPDSLSQIASGAMPILQDTEPLGADCPMEYNKSDLLIGDPSMKTEGSFQPNPDPSESSPLNDFQSQKSSNLEKDVVSRDSEEMDDTSSNVGLLCSTEKEESVEQIQSDVSVVTPGEECSLTNIDEASPHENIQAPVLGVDEEEKIPCLPEIPVVEPVNNGSVDFLEADALVVADSLLPPCDQDLSLRDFPEIPDVSYNMQSLVGHPSACVEAQESILSQEAEATERESAATLKSDEAFSIRPIEDSNLGEDLLFEKLGGEDSGTSLCLLEQTLGLTPDLEDLSDKCLLSSDDVKDLVESDLDKNPSHEDPQKQYIQMSNADLTEHDLADDFVDSGAILLDAPSIDEASKDDDLSAVAVDEEGPVQELSDLLSPEIQESEHTEGQEEKHVGFGGQCLKCGRRVRRGRKELVWFTVCYKCRLKAKREERHSGEGTRQSPEFKLEAGSGRKKGSSDFSSFRIKQEAEPGQDDKFYRPVKPVHGRASIKQESPNLLKKMFKCPKCEKSYRFPSLLAAHMKCHAIPKCLTCGCSLRIKCKGKRAPKRCHKCFQKMEEERALCGGGEDDSLDSDSGSLFVDEDDLTDDNEPKSDSTLSSTKLVEDLKPGSVKRGTEPFHSKFMRKRKQLNPALQALYCTCDIVLKSGGKKPKICKNCQKPVRNRFLANRTASTKMAQLKKTKKHPPSELDQHSLLLGEKSMSQEDELSADEFCKEEQIEPFTDLDGGEQMVPENGEAPRLCPQCGKLFKCKRSLNLHLLSHTATQCESCGCRLQKKKRVGRWSKKCRVCRLLSKHKGLPDDASEEVLLSEKIPKAKNAASLRMKMKQSKMARSRKIQSIAKHKKDLKWMNMILAVKGLTRKPRKKKEPTMRSDEKSDYSSDLTETDVCSSTEASSVKELATSSKRDLGLLVSQKKILGGIAKANRKCMYREKNIIKVEEQPLSPYLADPSTTPVSVKEEEENQCLECSEIFQSFDLLLGHQQVHIADQSFTCLQCPQRFSTEQYLSIHTSAHAEGPPFRCLECNKTFSRRNNLGVHRRVHTGARPYACPDCPCRFRQRCSLIIHRYTHRNLQFMLLKPFQCSICEKSFKQKERLVIHERLHTGECPFSCKDCDKVFPSKSRLYIHRKLHRSPEASSEKNVSGKEESGGQPFKCPDCDKICSTKASLVLHRKVHKSLAILDQSGSQVENLVETPSERAVAPEQGLHIKTEPDGHPFTCKDCNKVFSTKASFVVHRKMHHLNQSLDVGGGPAFVCKDCKKVFSTKASFVLHRKMHRLNQRSEISGGQAFVCKDCKKVCSTKASLVLHRKVHKSPFMFDLKANVGDPPYTCQQCNKVCSTKASFVLHSKVHTASSSGDHILKAKAEQKSFVCKDCGFVCSTKANFVLHRKVHKSPLSLKDAIGEHPFTCKDCNKVCSTKASLVLHSKVHKAAIPTSNQTLIPPVDVEDKPYHCKHCGKIYSTKGRLLSHLKLHSGQDTSADTEQLLNLDAEEKPFACPICPMRFTRMKILVRHKLIHGEDVFRCPHCAKRFLFHKSLLNHVPVCLKRSKVKALLGKEKLPKKRKNKDGGDNEECAPKKRKTENKKAATAVQKLKNKKLIKAKKLAMNKEKSKVKSSHEKKPKKPKGEAEQEPEAEGEKQSSGKPEKLPETVSKEKEVQKKPKEVGKVKKILKKIPPKQKRQKVSSESLKKWRIIAAATVKKRKLQAVISGGKKKVTVKKKGPSKAKAGGKSKE